MSHKIGIGPSIARIHQTNSLPALITNLTAFSTTVITELQRIIFRLNSTITQDGDEPMLNPLVMASYTVATVPDATLWTAGIIYVSNETGGAVLAFSDGTNWRRVTDRAIIA